MGSQKGVEQLEGTTGPRQRRTNGFWKRVYICISSVDHLELSAVGWGLKETLPLPGNHTESPSKPRLASHQACTTYTSIEREVREVTLLHETLLVLRNTITDLKRRVNLWSRALQRFE
jgi:hypothetical protein